MLDNLIFNLSFTDRGYAWNIIRSLLAWFDSIVYTVLGWFFQTIFYVSNFQMNILYEEVQERVYVILGIFMLFKLVVSFLTYLINPDKMSDKEQGVGKLVTRILFVLIMFLALPTIFNVMTDLQNRLVPVIPRVIIGQTGGTDLFDDDPNSPTFGQVDVDTFGKQMSLNVYRAFFRYNESCDAEKDEGPIEEELFETIDDAVSLINEPCPNNEKLYLYNYTPIVPLIVGIIMVVVVVGINLDIGIRSFKLLILRGIAPIPIISYIDPKSSKDGAFSKWVKMLFSTWLSLFINLGIVYLIIYLIGMLFSAEVWKDFFGNWSPSDPVVSALALIIVVIALLFFAKEAPQFVLDALGIKSAGSFGKMLGLAASGLGMVGAGKAAYQASRTSDETLGKGHGALNTAKNIGAGLFGGLAGGMTGAQAALGAKDHQMRASMDAISKRNATALAAGSSGSTLTGRTKASLSRVFAGETLASAGERKIKALEEFNKSLDAIGKRTSGEMVKNMDTKGSIYKGSNISTNYKSFKAAMDAAASEGKSEFSYVGYTKDASGRWVSSTYSMSMEEANNNIGWILKMNEDDYIKQVKSGTIEDKVLTSYIEDATEKGVQVTDKDIIREFYPNGNFEVSGRDSIKKTQDAISIDITAQQRANAVNKANDSFSGKK